MKSPTENMTDCGIQELTEAEMDSVSGGLVGGGALDSLLNQTLNGLIDTTGNVLGFVSDTLKNIVDTTTSPSK